MTIKQIEAKDTAKVREQILKEQNGKCYICSVKITKETGSALDHQHKLKRDKAGPDGKGLIRGVLCRACNTWEGKIWNSTTRCKQPKNVKERIESLKSLIRYYEKGTYPMIHPREKPRTPKLPKSKYNQLKKAYTGNKMPTYPKSGKITIALKNLFDEYEIII